MKNNIKYLSFISLFSLFSLISCKENKVNYVDLVEAINNTNKYCISTYSDKDISNIFECFSDDYIYYAPSSSGYIKIDDSSYYHSFQTEYYEDETHLTKQKLLVYGKGALLSQIDQLNSNKFINIISKYLDDFIKVNDYTYSLSVKDISTDLKNYFQSKNYAYSNYYELTISKNGRLNKFTSYEKSKDSQYVIGECYFNEFKLNKYEPYTNWVKDGKKIETRIFDLKVGYFDEPNIYHTFYNNEDISIEGIVNSISYDGHIYIANSNDTTGNVGIKVNLDNKNNLPKLGDKIKVDGVVKIKDYVSYIDNAKYTYIDNNINYPYFEEEAIATIYGGGYYLANIFSMTPIYGDSVYSTFCYINEKIDTNLTTNEEVYIDLIFPNMVNNETKKAFQSTLFLPKSMDLETKNKVLDELNKYKVYGVDSDAKELYLEKVITKFDVKFENLSYLEFSEFSEVSPFLTPKEKITKYIGIDNLDIVNVDTYSCYKFGNNTNMNLELLYGVSGSTSGVYYEASNMTKSQFEEQISNINKVGFTLFDKQYDNYLIEHSIYKYNDYVIDMYNVESAFGEGYVTLYMWIYKDNIIHGETIIDKINKNIPYFNSNEFIIPKGVYSSQFNLFNLNCYAGKDYKENTIPVITIDINTNLYTDLRNRYINELGYKTYRNSDNSIYTYKTRGVNHYILYKEISGSNEYIYLDMSMYPTSDYTFAGHNSFSNRIEIAIYKGAKPLEATYFNNLDEFSNLVSKANNISPIKFNNLPSDTKVEMYYVNENGGSKYLNLKYGYTTQYEAFIYSSDLSGLYKSISDSLISYGYKEAYTTSKGNVCFTYIDSTKNVSSYIFIIKDSSKNYIRIMDGVGGVDF